MVPVLVVCSLMISVVGGIAAGIERPYPGFALGSGLLLVVERAVAVWAATLLVLVVVDKSLRGRLPDEISGRGVRYVAQEQLDDVAGTTADAGDAVTDRLDELEAALKAFGQRMEGP
ncbi:MAG: hypothetical protein ITG02_09870 [Patulibacter sp.]|nr:hypothetical protein [Patulibacter sp.]